MDGIHHSPKGLNAHSTEICLFPNLDVHLRTVWKAVAMDNFKPAVHIPPCALEVMDGSEVGTKTKNELL